ncbi:hypothetical protein TMPK1_21410 [Rhodospirillales bacterium TMPK1]|uniref:Uncharacterized protein n=1 Tax=Roseiterribacter gracilis TaxID=2812848 RepID=A0A8S8XAX7_9PROT|nr:hypothetical protein TMPK1_21410 [Rhodospirillales bacterium TMPK1]
MLVAGCAQPAQQAEVDWRKYLPKDYKAQRSSVSPRVAGVAPAVPPGALTPPDDVLPEAHPSALMPAKLVGLSDAQLKSQLGVPTEEREAGAARIWTWRGRDCAVEAWLYYDTARAGFYALDQQMSGRAVSVDSCLRGVAKGA